MYPLALDSEAIEPECPRTILAELSVSLSTNTLMNSSLPGFDEISGADDSGTAFNIVQGGKKTIVIPGLYFYTFFPEKLIERIFMKYRRANHLVSVWMKAFRLLLINKLILSKKIAVSMIFIYIL